jgi:hypothetical protein
LKFHLSWNSEARADNQFRVAARRIYHRLGHHCRRAGYGITLLFDRQFADDGAALPADGGAFAQAAVWLVIALTVANVATTLLECGFGACADNPVVYELLKHPT